ncbi:MAG: DUF1631 family protein, partial [Thermomonas sp.]
MSSRTPPEFADAGRNDPGLLLDALQKQTLDRVVPALDRALGRVDDYLFDRSQSGDDALGLTALRDLRRIRGQIGRRFEQAVIAGFRSLRDPRISSQAMQSALSLLSEDGLEEQLAHEQLAESLARMHAPSLELLGKRIAHLTGRENLQAGDNPLTPTFIAAALRKAVGEEDLDAAVRIVIFKFFERELATALAHTYERSNTLLVAAGVLPDLRSTAKVEAMHAASGGQSVGGGRYEGGMGGGGGQGGYGAGSGEGINGGDGSGYG